MNLKGNQDQFAFAGTHEYTLVFAKNIGSFAPNELSVDEEAAAIDWIEDNEGWYKQGAGLVSTGQNSPRIHRPKLWFPILIDNELNVLVPEENEVDKLYDSELYSEFNKKMLFSSGARCIIDENNQLIKYNKGDFYKDTYKEKRASVIVDYGKRIYPNNSITFK